MAKSSLSERFLADAKTFCDELNTLFQRLDGEPENRELLEEAFRTAHSLKSESSFLEYRRLTELAHDLEENLETLRTGKKLWEEVSPFLAEILRDFTEERELAATAFYDGGGLGKEKRPDLKNGRKSAGEKGKVRKTKKEPAASFRLELDDFERKILAEAQKRGEIFFRLICGFEDSVSMKFAKAYLLLNNLELLVNVIRVFPSREVLEKEEFQEMEFFFTSAGDTEELYRAVNVDQVNKAELQRLDYGDYLPSGKDLSIEKKKTE